MTPKLDMLPEALAAFALLALCVMVHATGFVLLLWGLSRTSVLKTIVWFRVAWLLVGVAWWLLMLHLVEIALWGVFYHLKGCLPHWETAFYFSGVTYTTVGYGDVLLPQEWRILAPMEGLTGILMCGLSTSFFFFALLRLYERVMSKPNNPANKESKPTEYP